MIKNKDIVHRLKDECGGIVLRSNFDFLSGKWNEMYKVALSAEKNVLVDPNATIIKLRLFGELLSKYIYSSEGLDDRLRKNQKERIDYLFKEGTITFEIYEMLDSLRIRGNKAVHEANYGSINEAKRLLKIAFYLGAWLKQLYGEWNFELPEYREIELVEVVSNKNLSLSVEKPTNINTYKLPSKLTDTNVIRFLNNDYEYVKWLQVNGTGFVFNHFGGTEASKDMNKIHHASCRFLHRIQDEGKRTKAFAKICSTRLEDLEAHVSQLRGSSWVYCKSCYK